jgi:hypothetical protein
MMRVASDGTSIMHRCKSCKTEVAKPMTNERKRRPASWRVRRCGRAVLPGRTARSFRLANAS